MKTYYSKYLKRTVILTEERFEHIKKQHPEMLEYEYAIKDTIEDPDMIRKSSKFSNAKIFSKYYDNIRDGKHAVVVVISDFSSSTRDWIITSYIARKLSKGEILWKKN